MRVLLIEPDPTTATSLILMLSHAGVDAYHTDCEEDGQEIAQLYEYDLIISEMYPNLIRNLRKQEINTPILILSIQDDTESKIKAFGLGADDYLTKPFHREELIARSQTIFRRSRGYAQPTIKIGPMELNTETQAVKMNGSTIHLTQKEYKILELLCMRRGVILTKENFLDHLYSHMADEPEAKIIDVFICKLRKKLGDTPIIETVWGRGYRIPEKYLETTQ